jgi:hypothetical protein
MRGNAHDRVRLRTARVTGVTIPIHRNRRLLQTAYCGGLRSRQSGNVTPEPPISFGMSFCFGKPSLIRSFVSP